MADKVGKRVGVIIGALRRYMEKVDLREYAELRKTLSKELDRKTAEQWPDDEREQVVENIMSMIDETALYMCGFSMRFDPDDELFTALAKAGFHMAVRAAVSTFLARFEGLRHDETLNAENESLAASWNDFIQGINFDDLIDPDNPNADIWDDDND